MSKTFQLTANRWKTVAKNSALLRGRWVEVRVTTGRKCKWDKRPGSSGTFRKKKGSMLEGQSLRIQSPVDTTCTRTWVD